MSLGKTRNVNEQHSLSGFQDLRIYGICFAVYPILMSFSWSPFPGLTQDWKYNPWFWSCRDILMALILSTDTSVGLFTVWRTYVRLCRAEIQNTNFALVVFLIITVHYFQGQLLAASIPGSCRAAGCVCALILQSLTLQPWYHPVTEPTDNEYSDFLLRSFAPWQNELLFASDHSSSTAASSSSSFPQECWVFIRKKEQYYHIPSCLLLQKPHSGLIEIL